MEMGVIQRARERLERAAAGRATPAELEAAIERARAGVESLAEATTALETTIPDRLGDAIRESIRGEAQPLARQVAELRGLANQSIRRLERLEEDLLAERHARVDDLALLVDITETGWKTIDARLARIEQALLERQRDASIYPMPQAS
jgi:hypothetical protein